MFPNASLLLPKLSSLSTTQHPYLTTQRTRLYHFWSGGFCQRSEVKIFPQEVQVKFKRRRDPISGDEVDNSEQFISSVCWCSQSGDSGLKMILGPNPLWKHWTWMKLGPDPPVENLDLSLE